MEPETSLQMFAKNSSLVFVLSQMNAVRILTSYCLESHFNMTSPIYRQISRGLFS
jgi:hypothetical protein